MKNSFQNGTLDLLLPIYDAAIEPEFWSSALDSVNSFIGSRSSSMMMVDYGEQSPYSLSHLSKVFRDLDPDCMPHYVDKYSNLELEAWEYLERYPERTVVEDKQIWPHIETIRDRDDYRYIEEHLNVYRRMVARLNGNKGWFDVIALQFDSSMLDIPAESIEKCQLLLPHIAKSFEMGRTYKILKEQYNAVLSALDHINIGMCIVLNSNTVVVVNEEARRIFDLDDGLTLGTSKQMGGRNTAVISQLQRTISRAAATATGNGDTAENLFSVPRRSGKRDFLVETSPLRDSLGELEVGLSGALVTIIDPENPRPFKLDIVTKVYKLSSAEDAVCHYLLKGWTNPDIAEERRVTIDTVKAQVANIMRKTQTRSRAGLIRLIVKTSPPILRVPSSSKPLYPRN